MCKVTIAGDLAPLSVNQNLFEKGDANLILNDLVIDSDLFVANLECPITNSENPIKKSGPNIKASLGAVNGVKSVGIELVNLSNNHILDFGEKGFQDTITELTNSQIEYFGAGKNIKKANAVHVNEISGLRIGFYGVSEFEWSIATDDSSGANPIDRINFLEAKKKLELDHLIVFIHGGKEHYNLPTPKLQKLARFYADYGASAVICQHTHIVGCYEIYNKIPIFYGQGNFIFNNPNNTTAIPSTNAPSSLANPSFCCSFISSLKSIFENNAFFIKRGIINNPTENNIEYPNIVLACHNAFSSINSTCVDAIIGVIAIAKR